MNSTEQQPVCNHFIKHIYNMSCADEGVLECSWQMRGGRFDKKRLGTSALYEDKIQQLKESNHWQVIQGNPTFSKPAEEPERRTGHISIHSIMCHPPTGINLLELACPAFLLQLHLTASLLDYWASILAEYSTDIKDTWPLSHAKTLSALLHHNAREKTEREGTTKRGRRGETSERLNIMFGGVRRRDSKWRNWKSEAMEGVGGGALQQCCKG